ncbi:hypothetical protein Z517_02214 [Fonsecaea pedrosoi CBS 271.37]|uniref:Uncharacterized protein n=1 Tax=Fonsecaea pedrosoi CBS 271.37 TaxID=1442368 RepID=A0A0D2DYY8_9EURO|nr:uncharacterized protein Z517_02214 [Fonsecaea pedrosoi CBS 271.37]KIW82971.1 hypothetical protein Z517_02214 [Fonsecaea pedrosoi CBS 271.37]
MTLGNSSLSKLLAHTPAMLDDSSALTAAVACLSDTRKRQMLATAGPKVDPILYGHTLRCLRMALEDVVQLKSRQTLLATIVMAQIDAATLTTTLPNLQATWSAHLSGVGFLLEHQGVETVGDDLTSDIITDVLQPRHQPFFLGSPKWKVAFCERPADSLCQRLSVKIFRIMTVWPDVMGGLRGYHCGKVEFDSVLSKVMSMSATLESMEGQVQMILADSAQVRTRPATAKDSPVDEVYQLDDSTIPRVCCYHALCTIVTLNMLAALQGWSAELREHAASVSKRIWMCHEYVLGVGIFGLHYYPTALLLSYGSAESDRVRDWIVSLLNHLQGRTNPATDALWTRDELAARCFAVSGRQSSGVEH